MTPEGSVTEPADPLPPTGNGLFGRYYYGDDWSEPAHLQRDLTIDMEWPDEPPLDHEFGVWWVGYLEAPTSGSYVIALTSLDGSAVAIDGELVVDTGADNTDQATIGLGVGLHPISVRYAFQDCGGTGSITLEWTAPGESGLSVIPQARLYSRTGPPDPQLFGTGDNGWTMDPSGRRAEPVNTATGAYLNHVTDLLVRSPGPPVEISRTYNSLDTGTGVLGPGWSFSLGADLTWEADGTVTFRAADGARLTFLGDGGANIGSPGVNAELRYVAEDDRYELTRQDGLRNLFDEAGRLIGIIDLHDNEVAYTYTGGQLTGITDAVGREFTLAYADGLLTSVTDPLERTVAYTYDENDRLETVTDVTGGVTTYTYDGAGRLETIVDQNDHTLVTNTYDGQTGRIVAQLDALNHETTFAWDPQTETSTMTDARDGEWVDDYDANRLMSVTDPLGNTTTYTYDIGFNRTSVTDPNDHTTTYTFDGAGRVLSETAPAPLGYVQSWTYDGQGNVTSHTDALDRTTTYDYTWPGDLHEVTFPDETTIRYTYLASGLVATMTDQLDKVTEYDYDADGNLTSITSPLDDVTSMTYDAVGRMVTRVDARGNEPGADPEEYTTTFENDDADRLVSVTDALGHETVTTYDPAGNRTSVTDPNDHATGFTYDAANHLVTVTDAADGETTYDYDATGNLINRTDANDHETTYAYDLAGRLTGTSDPLDHEWTIEYDDAGNAIAKTDANDHTTSYEYDELNRLTAITYASSSTPPGTYAYDEVGNRVEMTDGAGTETYEYDELYRLTRVERGDDSYTYEYDDAGRIVARYDPAGTETTYAYDDTGRVVGVEATAGPIVSLPPRPIDLIATLAQDGTVELEWSAPDDLTGIVGYDVVRDDWGTVFRVDSSTTEITDRSTAPGLSYTYAVVTVAKSGSASYSSNVATGAITDDDSRYQAEVLGDSPVAYWRLGEITGTDLLDAAGSNEGEYVQGAERSPWGALAGDANAAAWFDAEASGHASVPDAAALDLGDGPFSIELWFNGGEDSAVLVGKDNGSDGYRVALDASGRIVLATGAGDANVRSEDPHADGNWHHVVVTRGTSGNGHVYVDGVDDTEAVTSATFTDTSAPLTIGAANGGTALHFAGDLDEIAIYDRELTPQEVADHHDIGTTYANTIAPSTPSDLTATANETNGIVLDWTASTDDVGVQGYVVYRDASAIGVAGTTSYVDPALADQTTYTYTVSAIDGSGNESSQSNADGATASGPGFPYPEPVTVEAAYTYDAAGNLLTEATSDGITATHTYDRAGRLLEVANVGASATLSRTSYSLDPAGNRLVATTTRGSSYYTYDELDRLTGVCTDWSCAGELEPVACLECVGSPMTTPEATIEPDPADIETTFTYDPVGNRLTMVDHTGATGYTYDDADRLTEIDPPGASAITYTHDANGNLTAAGSTTYTWDLADRLASATVGAATETYTYAGDGVRLSAERDEADATIFLVDRNRGLPEVVAERDAWGDRTRTYLAALGLLAQLSGEGTIVLHRDGLGSITDAATPAGDPVAWTAYKPYGEVRAAGAAEGAPVSAFAFTGQHLDSLTGLYHLRARQYDPATGRFLAVDPATRSISAPFEAAFAYASNNPARYVDPAGLESVQPGSEWQTRGACLKVQAQVGLMGGVGICLIGGHLQLQLQAGASTGVGGSITLDGVTADAASASDLAGWGAGFGASGGGILVGGADRCYAKSGGRTVNCVSGGAGVGFKVSPEFFTPAEGHAYGSFTIDFNDAIGDYIDRLNGGPGGAGGGF